MADCNLSKTCVDSGVSSKWVSTFLLFSHVGIEYLIPSDTEEFSKELLPQGTQQDYGASFSAQHS